MRRRTALAAVGTLSTAGCLSAVTGDDSRARLAVGDLPDREACRLPDSLRASLGVEVGQQVRVGADGECALFTVVGGGDDLVVSAAGRKRLTLDAGTAVRISPEVETPESAPYRGTFAESATERGTDILACAPHGGEIEPYTDAQATHLAGTHDASTWLCRGTWPDGSAFDRWHITSTAIDRRSFPGLARATEFGCRYAVSFNGAQADGVAVGGGASRDLREQVRDAIDAAVPVEARLATRSKYRGASPENLVNFAAETGIQLEQGTTARHEHAEAIAEATADALLG